MSGRGEGSGHELGRSGQTLLQQPLLGPLGAPRSQVVSAPPAVYGVLPGGRSFPSGPSPQSTQNASAYLSSPGFAATASQSPLGSSTVRSVSAHGSYTSQAFAPQMPYTSQPPYAMTFQSYPTSTSSPLRPPMTPIASRESIASPSAGESGYHLPPIRPAPPPFQQQQFAGSDQWFPASGPQRRDSGARRQAYQQQAPVTSSPIIGGIPGQHLLVPAAQSSGEQAERRRQEPKRQKMHLGEMLGPREE